MPEVVGDTIVVFGRLVNNVFSSYLVKLMNELCDLHSTADISENCVFFYGRWDLKGIFCGPLHVYYLSSLRFGNGKLDHLNLSQNYCRLMRKLL